MAAAAVLEWSWSGWPSAPAGSHPLVPLISAIGASIFLQSLALLLFGPNDRLSHPVHLQHHHHRWLAFLQLTGGHIGYGPGIHALLLVFVRYTRYGKAIVACALDRDTARLMGINVDRMVALTFLIGSA